jgi:hypothetical protein
MMGIQTRYFLGRLLKRGQMTSERVIEAMEDPVIINYRGTKYSFIDFQIITSPNTQPGYFAKIAKYRSLGAVEVVHEASHASAETAVSNLIEAASPFIYLPEFSGIAYRHIWNRLPSEQFERVFKELVETRHQKFFTGCDIERIPDLRTFVTRLSKFDLITELQATVTPPNPLFGPCWESLFRYMKKRNLAEVSIKEQSNNGINTKLKDIASAVLEENSPAQMLTLMEPLLNGVGDAALLMAADGYGKGKVGGLEDGKSVYVKTTDNQQGFSFESDPNPELLYQIALQEFNKNSLERGLRHP